MHDQDFILLMQILGRVRGTKICINIKMQAIKISRNNIEVKLSRSKIPRYSIYNLKVTGKRSGVIFVCGVEMKVPIARGVSYTAFFDNLSIFENFAIFVQNLTKIS